MRRHTTQQIPRKLTQWQANKIKKVLEKHHQKYMDMILHDFEDEGLIL